MFLEIYILNALHYDSWIVQPLWGSYSGHILNPFWSHNSISIKSVMETVSILNYKKDWPMISNTDDKWYDSSIFKRKGSYLLTLTYLTYFYWFILKITFSKYFAREAGDILYFLWYLCVCHFVTYPESHKAWILRCALFPHLFLWNSAIVSLWDSPWMTKWQRF